MTPAASLASQLQGRDFVKFKRYPCGNSSICLRRLKRIESDIVATRRQQKAKLFLPRNHRIATNATL
jgi:hypothetical protein